MVSTLTPVDCYKADNILSRCKLDCSHDYLQRLKYLNLESLELRRIYNDLIMVYKIFHGLVNVNANELINVKISTSTISTRGHRFKLQTSQFKRDVAKNQFCNRVVSNWNNLPDSIVAIASIVHFKKALRTAHFEAALTFNRHYKLTLFALHLLFYSYVVSAVFAQHHCGRL